VVSGVGVSVGVVLLVVVVERVVGLVVVEKGGKEEV
jgi:hypothetical protein